VFKVNSAISAVSALLTKCCTMNELVECYAAKKLSIPSPEAGFSK